MSLSTAVRHLSARGLRACCLPALLAPCSAFAATPLSVPFQLTHSITMDPSFAPDGKRLVYITVVEDKEQLFTMNADGSDRRQITHDASDHEDPAWSPDGKRIAYVSIHDGFQIITLIDPDGSHPEALTPQDIHVIHPRWHPDGARLAYCTTDDLNPPAKNASEIQEIDLRTRKIKTLVTGGINTYPAFSPDGRKLAFRKFVGESNSEVFVANSDGSDAKNVSNDPAIDGWPAWSPDGAHIAFASNRRFSFQIFLMRADGSDVRLVANTDGRATAPTWAPNGKSVLFPLCKNADYGVGCEILSSPIP
ncbi:MAG: hypothetical protein ABJA62_02680 [Luteimonas sp.]